MSRFTEARFVEKLREARKEQADAGVNDWFGFERADYDDSKIVTVDTLLVKGVGVDRDTNDDMIDYHKVTGLESLGIRQFHHKFDFGMQEYYYLLRYQEELRNL